MSEQTQRLGKFHLRLEVIQTWTKIIPDEIVSYGQRLKVPWIISISWLQAFQDGVIKQQTKLRNKTISVLTLGWHPHPSFKID